MTAAAHASEQTCGAPAEQCQATGAAASSGSPHAQVRPRQRMRSVDRRAGDRPADHDDHRRRPDQPCAMMHDRQLRHLRTRCALRQRNLLGWIACVQVVGMASIPFCPVPENPVALIPNRYRRRAGSAARRPPAPPGT